MKLITLNIEKDRHFERVIPFLQKEAPDVVCLQEIFQSTLDSIGSILDMQYIFAPMGIKAGDNLKETLGIAIFSKYPMLRISRNYYNTAGRSPETPVPYDDWSSIQKVLLSGSIKIDSVSYHVGTTHFTWTPDGQANEAQRVDLKNLLKILEGFDDIVFCGDFNAPRGREIFTELAQHYKDNIPQEITKTLDQNLHKAKGLQYVVDGLFSTPHYDISNVRIVDGVSDHCAVVADITTVSDSF